MSPWEVIGWVIALPLIAFSLLITVALLVGVVKHVTKKKETPETKGRHLRLLDDNEPA